MGGNNANYRRQIARTCKKLGLLVQPNALPALIREMETNGNDKFLELLQAFQNRLARAPSPRLVTLQLVEDFLSEQQQGVKKQRPKMVLEEEHEQDVEESQQNAYGQKPWQSETNRRPKAKTSKPLFSDSDQASWKVVSAFETPKLVYDSLRRQFRYETSPSVKPDQITTPLMGTASDLLDMRTQRYELVKQKVDRYRQQQRLEPLTTIDRLLGTRSKSDERTLLGMLKSNPALGCLELEDPTGSVPLHIATKTTDIDEKGIYLEGTLVLVRGNHQDSESLSHIEDEASSGTVFRCLSIDLPPLEFKEDSKTNLPPSPHDLSGRNSLQSPVPIYSLSNLSLDEEDCLERVKRVLDRMIEEAGGDNETTDSSVGAILVLFGNFCTETCTTVNALEELANLLKVRSFPSKHSILLVPGPRDVGSNACWPLPAFHKRNTPSSLHPFLANNGTDGNVHLCSNPCRLEFCDGRQVVLMRKDLIRESLQHTVLANTNNADRISPLPSRVFHHAMSQCHLSNGHQQTVPIYWKYDHAMSLVPLPDLVIVGLDAEYLEEGSLYGRAGCRFVAPISNPSRGEWQCAVAVLSRKAEKGIHVEFDNDDDGDDEEMEDSQEMYENYRILGGTQTTELSQEQLSVC